MEENRQDLVEKKNVNPQDTQTDGNLGRGRWSQRDETVMVRRSRGRNSDRMAGRWSD